jgi:RNA polymerase sigma-70 factor (ECF subfamily)
MWNSNSETDQEPVTDRELVRRTRRGDGTAYDELVRRYLPPALAVAWEFTESRADAEDVVQDAFHRALRGLDSYDERRPFRPWFFTIVRNAGRNAAAWRNRWSFEPLDETLPADPCSPLSAVERREVRERIGAGLELLPPMQRTCFRLCDLEGFRASEVGEMLDLEESTVRVHRFRARRGLREALKPLRDEAEPHREGKRI